MYTCIYTYIHTYIHVYIHEHLPHILKQKDVKYTDYFSSTIELSFFYIAYNFPCISFPVFSLQLFYFMNYIINFSLCLEAHALPHRECLQAHNVPGWGMSLGTWWSSRVLVGKKRKQRGSLTHILHSQLSHLFWKMGQETYRMRG